MGLGYREMVHSTAHREAIKWPVVGLRFERKLTTIFNWL